MKHIALKVRIYTTSEQVKLNDLPKTEDDTTTSKKCFFLFLSSVWIGTKQKALYEQNYPRKAKFKNETIIAIDWLCDVYHTPSTFNLIIDSYKRKLYY